ncbi:MAG: molybdopterin-dependent oxidoreductase [Eggerthellaceae bacterium]|nr:molybdopterin-dependent oxidoreductase [Eggerthellaceae bacterium]
MNKTAKKAAGITGSALMLASMGAGAMVAFADQPEAFAAPSAEAVEGEGLSQTIMLEKVVGTFSFTQANAASKEAIMKAMAVAGQYLCGGQQVVVATDDVSDWAIEIGGAVRGGYTTTIGDLEKDPEMVSQLMGCMCVANPIDGAASVNAQVTGVPVLTLLERAGMDPAANTAVFKSADGYEVALPLIYLKTHLCPIVFNVAGSPIVESMGGANQLWLGSTSANYFARDIVSITLEVRDEAPAAPGTPEAGDDYANLPNVGIAFGGEVE